MGKSSSGGSQKTEMQPWKPAQGDLKNILGQAKALYEKNGGMNAEAIQREIPNLTPEMAKSLEALGKSGQLGEIADNLNKYTTHAGEYLDQAGKLAQDYAAGKNAITGEQINTLTSQLYDSDLVQQQKAQLQQELGQQYQANVQQLNQQATAAGSMGNSRAGVAQGVMSGKEQEAYAKGSVEFMGQARQSALTAAMSTLQSNQQAKMQGMQTLGTMGTTLASQYAANEQARGQMYQQQLNNQYNAAQVGQTMQAQQQETRYQNAVAQQQAGWNNLNNYANLAGKIGMGLQSQTTTGGQGGPSQGASALGGAAAGAAMGSQIMPGWGTAAGAVIGGVSGWMSDATLKKKIKIKGKTKDGEEVYSWDWNEKAKKKGKKGPATGVLAQRSGATIGAKNGALMVDYDKTSVKPSYSKSA